MAQFDVRGLDGIMDEIERMGQFDKIAPKMMQAGMEILQEEVVAEASKHRDTGEMVESIKPTGMTRTIDGYYMCTRPTGYAKRKKWKNARKGKGEGKGRAKVRNMEKLVWLEYGVKGRPATPVVTAAVIRAEPKVMRAMKEVFEQET